MQGSGYTEYYYFNSERLKAMFIKTVYVSGLTPQMAKSIVHVASQYVSDVELDYQGRKVNVKSILGVLSLGTVRGEMTLTTKGPDEYEALKAMSAAMEQTETRPAS
ncbi:HPr family phosphocarrier protein [Domibacillus indicus]|uniref:HPr family phosphocarrier protein n=1 Tax=Domibacillus indicus TaxID=1437523 RepID=UPI000697A993|nr:HPr family phosphocarrier protein [Domibacillus indicus]